MKNRKRMIAAGAGIVFLLTVVAMSEPGRAAIGRVMALILPASKPAVETASTEAMQSEDAEERARRKHGWNGGVTTSLLRGSIIYFDNEERAVEQWAVTIYRRYPEQARVEINRGKGVEVYGFDGTKAWREGATRLTEEEARDIRAIVRIWPERLFVTRASGAAYRESGQRVEPGESGTVIQDQVEVEDAIGPVGGDRRRVSYYINRESAMVEMASWLEPDDPRRKIDDEGAALKDVRVEFGRWKSVGGVMWPMEVTHREGGRRDFRIEVNEVKVNAQIDDAKFRDK
ncbi:MAG: hypothetical protein AB1631_13870 [Acidobacteriota bacterium]